MQAHTSAIVSYFAEQQPSTQWRDFLTALAEEFDAQLDAAQLRQLMARVGERFAAAHAIEACDSLDTLAAALNAIWSRLDWGFVDLVETDDHLAIQHFCAPLAAFGPNAHAWTPGFLEGAYQYWLRELGAGSELTLTQLRVENPLALEFRLVNEGADHRS
ncbi:cellulose synthase [Trinickia terrae]|uniref:Cellulose synthase n=2 Tax=Trinickia terrae TaxID=2571161 RepID=A0A4U1HP24_9BURK|nr:cellulose synthase [Trinickia terrae]